MFYLFVYLKKEDNSLAQDDTLVRLGSRRSSLGRGYGRITFSAAVLAVFLGRGGQDAGVADAAVQERFGEKRGELGDTVVDHVASSLFYGIVRFAAAATLLRKDGGSGKERASEREGESGLRVRDLTTQGLIKREQRTVYQ